MATLRSTLAITLKELQVTLRDRGLLAVLFVLPLVFGTLFSVAQQGDVDEATGATAFSVDVFVVNADEGPYGAQVAASLEQMPMLKVETLATADEADRRVGEGERTAAIVIPADFSAGIEAYEPVRIAVVVDPVQQALSGTVVGLVNFAASPVSTLGELRHGTRTFLERSGALAGAGPEVIAAAEEQSVGAIMTQIQAMQANPTVEVVSEGLDADQPSEPVNVMDLMMPAFAVMFAFFLVGHIGRTFHRERDEGTYRRLLASPLSRTSIIAGPMLAYVAIVVLQVVFLFGIGAGLFGLRIGNSLIGLLVVSLTLGLVVACFGMLVSVLTRSGKQADTLGTLVAFVLPFISGIFPMGSLTPEYLRGGVIASIGNFIPHMHAAEAYRLVMTGEGTFTSVMTQVGILLVFAAVFFALASRRLRFR